MNKSLYEAAKNRRSIYAIGRKEVVSRERIQEIVNNAMLFAPTAMNSQSGRIVVLFDKNHDRLWEITRETLRKMVPVDAFAPTDAKIDSFKAGSGTVLFFEDTNVVKGLEEQYALYKDNFQPWSLQSSGMLQYIVWTALEAEGLGASLQHYNPIIDQEVKEVFNIPASYKLLSQMPFGSIEAQAGERNAMPVEERVRFID
jgi:hypothetical protein